MMTDPPVIERPYASEARGEVTSDTVEREPDASDDAVQETRFHEDGVKPTVINEKAQAMIDHFESDRDRAKEALLLAQVFQRRAYNNGRLLTEFEEGDLVVLNPHSLRLLKDEKGRGKKLLMKYDGPFEIIRKLSPVTYQIRLPVSYGINPIINIAHLEQYFQSPPKLGNRPTKHLNRADFEEVPEEQVEYIISQRWRKRGMRRIREYKVRWRGYGPEHDEWLTRKALQNAPAILQDWESKNPPN
jgi:hypothetical protein